MNVAAAHESLDLVATFSPQAENTQMDFLKRSVSFFVLIFPVLVFAKETDSSQKSFQISCDVELINGATPKLLNAQSKFFTANKDTVVGSASEVRLKVGPYTLLSKIDEIVDKVANVPVIPPSHPMLNMNIFDGNPIGKSIFLSNAEGFDWSDFTRPLILSGFQFRDFTHEGVKYSRMDYKCALRKVANSQH